MTKEELYKDQLARFQREDIFNAQDEYIERWSIKSGRFGEELIREMLGSNLVTETRDRRIIRSDGKGKYYEADGYIKSLDIYIESKFLTFWSAGTAPEKLPYFLFKAEHYDKPVVLVLGGEHELLKDEPSYHLWTAFNEPEKCQSRAALALVGAVGDRLAGVVKLSELRSWVASREAKQLVR